MKKKVAMVLMVIFMVSGIIFSIANYVSIDLKGFEGNTGHWEYNEFGEKECFSPGSQCSTGAKPGI